MTPLPNKPEYCPTCATKFEGPFCHACGERQPTQSDFTLKKYAAQAVDMFTHFDGKFFKTIKYLLFFPGKLTEENLAGRKVMLMKPVQLYVVINLVYFFLMKSIDVFMIYLNVLVSNGYARYEQAAEQQAAKKGMDVTEYITRFDEVLPTTSKTFVFVLIPVIAVCVWLLYFKKSKNFIPHLIFSTHLFSFLLVLTLVFVQIITLPLQGTAFMEKYKIWVANSNLIFIGIYVYFALKRVYQQNTWVTLGKTVVVFIWIAAAINLYRTGIVWLNFLLV